MKTKTEKILIVMKILALLGGVGYSIEWGSRVLSFVAGFINPEWAKRVMDVDQVIFSLRYQHIWYYTFAMLIIIIIATLKAAAWWFMADLLIKLDVNEPFSMKVVKKLELIAYLFFGVCLESLIGELYMGWLSNTTGLQLKAPVAIDEYLFMAGIIYIVSQIFKRGIELQEENQLTV